MTVLTAYFDDSGTHESSQFLSYAAVLGTEAQWKAYETRVRILLDKPVSTRSSISRFHMTDIESSTGEFLGWSRAERDILIHDLREIMLDAGLWAVAFSLDQQAWDDVFSASAQEGYGTAEQACVAHLMGLVEATAAKMGSAEISIVFDNRAPEQRAAIVSAFSLLPPKRTVIKSITFADSYTVLPLQAADLVAWEAGNLVRSHDPAIGFRPRPHLQRLGDSGRFHGVVRRRESIEGYAAAESLKQGILILAEDSPEVVAGKVGDATNRIAKYVDARKARAEKRADRKRSKRTNKPNQKM